MTISYSNAAHRSHANTPYSWRIPTSRQGFIVLLGFYTQRYVFSFLSAGVWGCWRVFAGPCQSPRALGLVNQAGLRLFWAGVRL